MSDRIGDENETIERSRKKKRKNKKWTLKPQPEVISSFWIIYICYGPVLSSNQGPILCNPHKALGPVHGKEQIVI